MRREPWTRLAVALVAASSLTGCKMLRLGRLCDRGATCGASISEPYVVGDAVLGDSYVNAGYVDGDVGCTTCQKSFDVESEPVTVNEPIMVEGDGLMLPPVDGSESYAIAPEEQAVQAEPAKPDEPKQPVKVEGPTPPPAVTPPPPVSRPMPMPLPMPQTTSTNKPAALNLDCRSSMSVAMVGQEVVFDVVLANAGGSAIDAVEITANFSEGLRPKSVSPEGVARIDGQQVIFEPIRRFTPMTLSYRIVAEATPGMPESRLTVEVASPILTSGAIKRETVVRITP